MGMARRDISPRTAWAATSRQPRPASASAPGKPREQSVGSFASRLRRRLSSQVRDRLLGALTLRRRWPGNFPQVLARDLAGRPKTAVRRGVILPIGAVLARSRHRVWISGYPYPGDERQHRAVKSRAERAKSPHPEAEGNGMRRSVDRKIVNGRSSTNADAFLIRASSWRAEGAPRMGRPNQNPRAASRSRGLWAIARDGPSVHALPGTVWATK
jgi:hypothetical protein